MGQFTQHTNNYSVDIIMCIDATGSMSPIIDKTKMQVKDFYAMYKGEMENSGRHIGPLRVKVIVFRDFKREVDDPKPLVESEFYDLNNSEEKKQFEKFVDDIEAIGGGDDPENGLEAVALALKSKWNVKGGSYRRQVIVVFTDVDTYDLQNPERARAVDYPKGLPKNLEELKDIWKNGHQELAPYYSKKAGRLFIFAPDSDRISDPLNPNRVIPWSELLQERVWLVPVKPDGGCEEINLKDAMNLLVGSF